MARLPYSMGSGSRHVVTSCFHQLWSSGRRSFWERRPLRQKLALGVWLSIVPVSMVASIVDLEHAKGVVAGRVQQQLAWDADQANSWLALWEREHLRSLQFTADIPGIQSIQGQEARKALEKLKLLFPYYSFNLVGSNGSLVARAGKLSPSEVKIVAQLIQDPKSSYSKALAGISSSMPLAPPQVEFPCLSSSVPVVSQAGVNQLKTIGVLSSCLALQELGAVTGINKLIEAASDGSSALPLIDLDNGKPYGYALMLVLDSGSTILLGQSETSLQQQRLLLDSRRTHLSKWWPLIRLAMDDRSATGFVRVRLNHVPYFVAVDRSVPGRAVLMVLDERSAFSSINSLFAWIWLGNLLALVLSSFAIYRICGALSKPVDQAGEALSRISRGDFGEPLPCENNDVGRLFNYVNQASIQLQAYLADAKAHAITDNQLEEARRIQADFLIRDLPSTPVVELAAMFQPAYQIGADWYDALERDGLVFVVVADVCDKGIPSALYMSVFRSLLRLSLVNEWDLCHDPCQSLVRAIGTVNRYMADTHGSTAMFATAFVAAYDAKSQRLCYVVAGHEAPLVLRDNQLHSLSLGGPALGLFSAATFEPGQCQLGPGDLLFAFSDGLPDARTPSGESFGKARITALLQTLPSCRWTAAQLVEAFKLAVQEHMGTAEQFDDLTLLSLKVNA